MAIYLPVPGHTRPCTDFLSAVLHQLSQYGCSNIFNIYLSSKILYGLFKVTLILLKSPLPTKLPLIPLKFRNHSTQKSAPL